MPQCSRSITGLMYLLTRALARTNSLHASWVSTTSSGSEGFTAHSGLYSTQNSIQPIGARVGSPITTPGGCSAAVMFTPPKANTRDRTMVRNVSLLLAAGLDRQGGEQSRGQSNTTAPRNEALASYCRHFYEASCFCSFTSASARDTGLPITKRRTIPQASTQYTSIASSVVHSKTLPATCIAGTTYRNGPA